MSEVRIFEKAKWAMYFNAIVFIGIAVFLPLIILYPDGITSFSKVFLIFISPLSIISMYVGVKLWLLKDRKIILTSVGIVLQDESNKLIHWHEIENIYLKRVWAGQATAKVLYIVVGSKKVRRPLNMYKDDPEYILNTIFTYWDQRKNP